MTNPISGERTSFENVGCIGLPRGASNAPGPSDAAPDSDSAPDSGSAPDSDSAASLVTVGGYDPVTGPAAAPDGTQVQLGTDGGQYRLLGAQSWTALLTAVAGS